MPMKFHARARVPMTPPRAFHEARGITHDIIKTFKEVHADFLDQRWTPLGGAQRCDPRAPRDPPKGNDYAVFSSSKGPRPWVRGLSWMRETNDHIWAHRDRLRG